VAFIEDCLQFVSGCRDPAHAAEQNFFALASLPREATSVSRRFDALLSQLRHRLDLLRSGSRIPMPIMVSGGQPQSGNAEAQYSLGLRYFYGVEGIKNEGEGIKWLYKAAARGHVAAQSNLGNRYYCGEGVPQNLEAARVWWEGVTARGDASAQNNLFAAFGL
jgi:TPR repeat protein